MLVITAFSAVNVSAATILHEDDFDYAVINDDEYALYRYNGADTSPELPTEYREKPVVGIYSECFYEGTVTSVTIPSGYRFIGAMAFYHCEALSAVSIPSTITEMGNMTFTGCTSLTSLDLSKAEGLEDIPFSMCCGAVSLSSVLLPDGINAVYDDAFEGTAITSIDIPDSVIYVGIDCFKDCTSLERVSLPDKLKSIEIETFDGCTMLNTVNIPSAVTEIGAFAFRNCSSLNLELDIPYSLTTLGEGAFENVSGITSVFIPDTVTEIGSNCFSPMDANGTIKIICIENSAAAQYCASSGAADYTAVQKLMGDANLDGDVNILDVTRIQKNLIGKAEITAKQIADVNKDGDISVRDATMIQMYIAKILTEL